MFIYGFSVFILVTIYLFKFYRNVKKYPSGPFPVPVFGNILMLLWTRKTHPLLSIHKLCEPYGNLTTFWFGSKPVVIICDLSTARNMFDRIECCGRIESSINLTVCGDGYQSYVFKDYDKEVKFLRKLTAESIRQILSSKKLSDIVRDVVNETVDTIKSIDSDKKFSIDGYMAKIIIRIIAELTFNRSYSFDDNELELIQQSLEIYNNEILKLILSDFMPISKYFLVSNENSKSHFKYLNNLYQKSFEKCKDSYENVMRESFANSLLTARLKMIDEKRNVSQYLTDNNLVSVLGSMFLGSSDTTITTFLWIYLILAHYPDVQQKLRDEINDILGKRVPEVEDRKKLNYVNAFICETMRFRSITTFSLFHKITERTNIANYSLPKNTILLLDLYSILNDSQHWINPDIFMPERFLDSSNLFFSTRNPAFIPLSTGKRVCIGETLATELIFVILVCLLQATDGYQFVLLNGPQSHDLDYCTKPSLLLNPNPYEIMLKKV